jgi:hypothetical protein
MHAAVHFTSGWQKAFTCVTSSSARGGVAQGAQGAQGTHGGGADEEAGGSGEATAGAGAGAAALPLPLPLPLAGVLLAGGLGGGLAARSAGGAAAPEEGGSTVMASAFRLGKRAPQCSACTRASWYGCLRAAPAAQKGQRRARRVRHARAVVSAAGAVGRGMHICVAGRQPRIDGGARARGVPARGLPEPREGAGALRQAVRAGQDAARRVVCVVLGLARRGARATTVSARQTKGQRSAGSECLVFFAHHPPAAAAK